MLDAGSIANRPWSARNAGTTHGQFFVAPEARTDRQMRPLDCSTPPGTDADQQSSGESLLLGRCDSTPVASTKGSASWQEQAPATQANIGFASSATALRSFNDEIRMSNAFPRYDESLGSPTSPALGYLLEANFFETPPAGARLLAAGPPRALAVQGWDPNPHSLTMRQRASKSKAT